MHILNPDKVDGLALGIEFEFLSGLSDTRYEAAVNELGGWSPGYDGCNEVRSKGVTRLGDATRKVIELVDAMKELNPDAVFGQRGDAIYGMHVHINVEDKAFPSVDIGCLWEVYLDRYQAEAEALVVSTNRIQWREDSRKAQGKDGANHRPVPATIAWSDIIGPYKKRGPAPKREDYPTLWGYDDALYAWRTNGVNRNLPIYIQTKGWDFSPRIFQEWPTVELRVWDSTDDHDILAARFDLIRRMAVDAIGLMNERGITALEYQPGSMGHENNGWKQCSTRTKALLAEGVAS